MVLMLQREVAERMVAEPGSRDYGLLSVVTQYHTKPRKAFVVPASCFRPVPQVDSAVVCLAGRAWRNPADARFDEVFMKVVRGAFAHRRKTLINSCREEGWEEPVIRRALERTRIDPRRRAETSPSANSSPWPIPSIRNSLNRVGICMLLSPCKSAVCKVGVRGASLVIG